LVETLRSIQLAFRESTDEFCLGGQATGARLDDFWRWAYSDLASNTNRGVVAEFIVAHAIGATHTPRDPWMEYDLLSRAGTKVEVKSAAYLQSWSDGRKSRILFSNAPARQWSHNPVRLVGESRRDADVYVFCLLAHLDRDTLDPLQVAQWQFFVVPTYIIDSEFPAQKSLALSSLRHLDPAQPSYPELEAAVEAAGDRHRRERAA
jgi:hypothetical protein